MLDSAITLRTVKDRFFSGYYSMGYSENKIRVLPENYIFDEEKSVRWNKEAVAQWNNEVDTRRAQYRKDKADKERQLHIDVADCIAREYNLTAEQAALVEDKAYEIGHSAMSDYFALAREIGDFVRKVLDTSKERKENNKDKG